MKRYSNSFQTHHQSARVRQLEADCQSEPPAAGPHHHHDLKLAHLAERGCDFQPVPLSVRDETTPLLRHLLRS